MLFAADIAARFAPELQIKGAAAIALPTDLRRPLLADIASAEGRVLAPFTLQSWAVKWCGDARNFDRRANNIGPLADHPGRV